MKIAIITIHNIHNFGSVFQAYALCEYLTQKGYSAEIIDYNPVYFRHKTLKTYIGQLLYLSKYLTRKTKFRRFVNGNMILSAINYKSLQDLRRSPPQADIYMAGGDQLWNSYHHCGKDDAYKLDFAGGYKMTYGTSMGRKNYSEEELLSLASKIKEFQNISVRESSSVDLLRSVGIDSVHVADPVMLLSINDYRKFIEKPAIEKYLFVYLVTPSKLLTDTVKYLSSKMRLKVVLYAGLSPKCPCDYFLKDLGPEEILSYIVYADFVLSASFHATLFSIMYHKQFATLLPDTSTNERIEDLLDWTNLGNRIIKNKNSMDETFFSSIDYASVDIAINRKRETSRNFLVSSVKEYNVEKVDS